MAYNPYDNKSPYGDNPYQSSGPYGQPAPQQAPSSGPYGQSPYQNQSRPSGNSYGNQPPPPPPPPADYPPPRANYGNTMDDKYAQQSQPGYEMGALQQPGHGQPQMSNLTAQQASREIMNACLEIDNEVRKTKGPGGEYEQIQRAHKAYASSDDQNTLKEIDQQSKALMEHYRALIRRLKEVKKLPGAQSNPQYAGHVSKAQRAIETALNELRVEDERFRTQVVSQQARQYQIANQGMSHEEAMRRAEQDNGDTNIFQQQLANTNRYGQASSVLGAVQARHDAIQAIERTIIELAELQNDVSMAVEEQQPMIEKMTENITSTATNMETGNEQLVKATDSAKKARRKKWWCFWIVVALIIIIAVIIVIIGATQGWFRSDNTNNTTTAA